MLAKLMALGTMHIKEYDIYKSNFYLFTLNRIVEVVVYICVWQAIYTQTGTAGGFSISQMITYYILSVALAPIAIWGLNEDIAHSIRNGQIQRELLSPISYLQYYFGIYIGEMRFALKVGIATFVVCTIIWGVVMPSSLVALLAGIILILLGIPILYFLQMIIGITGFYTNSIWGMNILKKAIICIFAGMIAPINLFPEWFQVVANILPFQEVVYTPIYLYLGQIPIGEIGGIIIKQIIWIAILYILTKVFFHQAVKKVTINGG